MLIGFKYRLSPALANLASKEIADLNGPYIKGWLDEVDVNQLNHCSMYMVCEQDNDILRKPLAIIARNSFEALRKFSRFANEGVAGTVVCEIVSNCDDIKVEPTEEVLDS